MKVSGTSSSLLKKYREIFKLVELYAYLRYKRRQYYWEALRDDVYAPLRADRFCSDLRLPRRIYPDHHVLPRELFSDEQWNEMIVNPLPSPTRLVYLYRR